MICSKAKTVNTEYTKLFVFFTLQSLLNFNLSTSVLSIRKKE